METGMELKVFSPALPPEVAPAVAARDRALAALVALAEALGTPDSVPAALAEAEAALSQARVALKGLEGARQAAVGPAVALGTLGDEDEQRLRQFGAKAEEAAAALEREERRARQCQHWLRAGHGLTMGLMVLCGAVLSLDSVRTALGVTEDGHLLLALAVVAVSCEVAWWGLETSWRHLATAAGHQRDMALRLRDRAQQVAATRASAEAAADTNEATADVLGQLEEVTLALGTLVAAVTRDSEVTPWGTRGQGFPSAARALGDIVVTLGTSREGHKEVTRRLEVARAVLAGQSVSWSVPRCPQSVPGVSPAVMEPRELLEALVDVVTTLERVAATVAGPYGDVLLTPRGVSPRSLHTALGTFISHLQGTLGHHGHTSLGQALAAFRANLGATWAHVTAAASAWRGSVAKLEDSWAQLAREATELKDACRDAATGEATTAATANTRARDLQGTATRWEPSLHNLVAEAWQLPLALDKEEAASAVATHEARMAAANNEVVAATKAKEEAIVATSEAGAATRRRQRAEVALGLLERLVAACDKATAFPKELQRQLGDIEATLKGTNQASPDVPETLVAKVANAELLWEASARLATRHLVGTLGDIRRLLSSRPGAHTVTERCQRAIEDIPRLLQGQ